MWILPEMVQKQGRPSSAHLQTLQLGIAEDRCERPATPFGGSCGLVTAVNIQDRTGVCVCVCVYM